MGSLETLAHGETDGNIYRRQQKQYGLPTSQVRIPERFGRMSTPKFTIPDNHRRLGQRRHTRCKVGRLQDILTRRN